jgi:hypothetical protein
MSSADRPSAHRPSTDAPPPTRWRTSSFSDRGNCVAVARLDDGHVAVRNSNQPPHAGTLRFPPPVLRAWIDGVKAGEFDQLT